MRSCTPLRYRTIAELKEYARRRGVDLRGKKLKDEIVEVLEREAPIPTALELHPEWTDQEKALYEELRKLFKSDQTAIVTRREVQQKLLLKTKQLDDMPFKAQWGGRWRLSVGYWTCHVREALEAGVREWQSAEAFAAAKRKKHPPPEDVEAKRERKKTSLKRKIDTAFKKAGKEPLADLDAYSDLSHATLEVKQRIKNRRRVLQKKADRCEERYGDRRLAYESAGDTDESCYFDNFEQNVVDAYIQGHKNLCFNNMTAIANYLAQPRDYSDQVEEKITED